VHVKTIDPEEEDVGVQPSQCIFGDGTDELERVFAQGAAGENDFYIRTGKFGGNIDGIGHNRKISKVPQGVSDGGRGGPRVEYHHLSFVH